MNVARIGTSMGLAAVIAAASIAAVAPAWAQDDDAAERHRPPHFRFHLDDDSLHIHDFAMHFVPPDLSALEELEDLRFNLGEPMKLWLRDGAHRLVEHSKVAELEQESRELARRIREAEGAERHELEEELRQKLEEIFEEKMTLRRERIEQLEERLEEERENLRERSNARQRMIERRFQRLLGQDDVLEW